MRLRIWRLGVRIPRGAPPSPQLSGPVTGSLPAVESSNCDQTATKLAGSPKATATTCDHNRSSRRRSSWAIAGAGPVPWHPAGDGAAHQEHARSPSRAHGARRSRVVPGGVASGASCRPYAHEARTPGPLGKWPAMMIPVPSCAGQPILALSRSGVDLTYQAEEILRRHRGMVPSSAASSARLLTPSLA
jgi:hypothetical protein